MGLDEVLVSGSRAFTATSPTSAAYSGFEAVVEERQPVVASASARIRALGRNPDIEAETACTNRPPGDWRSIGPAARPASIGQCGSWASCVDAQDPIRHRWRAGRVRGGHTTRYAPPSRGTPASERFASGRCRRARLDLSARSQRDLDHLHGVRLAMVVRTEDLSRNPNDDRRYVGHAVHDRRRIRHVGVDGYSNCGRLPKKQMTRRSVGWRSSSLRKSGN
jgi:hypothetical protein